MKHGHYSRMHHNNDNNDWLPGDVNVLSTMVPQESIAGCFHPDIFIPMAQNPREPSTNVTDLVDEM